MFKYLAFRTVVSTVRYLRGSDKPFFQYFAIKPFPINIVYERMASNRYCIDVAKRGTAGCKNCKQKIEKGSARIGKVTPNPFTDSGGDMKQWFHVKCIFEALSRARASTKKIESTDDLEGFDDIPSKHKDEIENLIAEFGSSVKKTPQKKQTPKKSPKTPSDQPSTSKSPVKSPSPSAQTKPGKDDLFREFRRLCAQLSEIPGYNDKTAAVSEFFKKGRKGDNFDGDLYLWVKLLLPGVNKRVYNLQSKQLVKLFSQMFDADQDDMLTDLEQGDVAETVATFFEQSDSCKPVKKSTLTLQDVDNYLDELTHNTTEDAQSKVLKTVTKKCTSNDLKMFVRLIKHDLRINAGPKHILGALHPNAYAAYQAAPDLKAVVKRFLRGSGEMKVRASLMTPVLPMLAQPCRSMDMAFKKCPNGMYVEIKYDGERVQVHKQGDDFSYFSRSLKPVMPHKISHFKDYIPQAFTYGNDLILDSEILLVDKAGKPLPFGSLGAHKKKEFSDATVCLFVFDCLQYNDENLMQKPLAERRRILLENMKPIKNHILFSEQKEVTDPNELKKLMKSVMEQGLEGLMIKDSEGVYEPGKRHWLKMKKDYLEEGSMADSADLVVLGAYYGTGDKGGMKSIFLMGCWNERSRKWCTVTKVHGGHTDKVLKKLQTELKMTKISKDASKVPSWLDVNKSLVPDFVSDDPGESQVWEITGAEFTKAEAHTAAGISIRFPRVQHIRNDKTPKEATTLLELKELFKKSKETCDIIGLASSPKRSRSSSASDSELGTGKRKRSQSPSPKLGNRQRSKSRSKSRSRSPSRKKTKHSGSKQKISCSQSRSRSPSPAREKTKKSPSKRPKSRSRSRSKSPSKKSLDSSSRNGEQKKQTDTKQGFLTNLPDLFSGVKLFLPTDLDNYDVLKRYFIAFDGVLLKDYDKKNATHVVTSEPVETEGYSPLMIPVLPQWLWDCIKLKKIIPTDLYAPDPF